MSGAFTLPRWTTSFYNSPLLIKSFNQNYYHKDFITKELCIDFLVDNMIVLYIDEECELYNCLNFETNYFIDRTCEVDYADKILNLINFVQKKFNNVQYIHNVMDDIYRNRIIGKLCFRLDDRFKRNVSFEKTISQLKNYGELIDFYIKDVNDYHRFNYIVKALNNDNEYGYYHFFKSYALIELLFSMSDTQTEEIDKFLIEYLPKEFSESRLATVLRQMRNKIGHGDFIGFNKKSEEYFNICMKDYEIDYFEFSKQSWILINSCCLVDDVLRDILIDKLKINYFMKDYI